VECFELISICNEINKSLTLLLISIFFFFFSQLVYSNVGLLTGNVGMFVNVFLGSIFVLGCF
jgi:hypothetical protein